MTSYTLCFSFSLCSMLLSVCEDAAKHVKLAEQNEGNCFLEDTQSYALQPQQKFNFMTQEPFL